MTKKIAYLFFLFLKFFDNIGKIIFKKSFFGFLKYYLDKSSYKSIEILGKKINFFTPNQISEWRVNTFFTKEPETLEWINSFDNSKKIIFWDIGANIGLYSIYAALKHKNCEIISFEPSTSNLRILSRNISINNLDGKVKIFTNPLTNQNEKFLNMKEGQFIEGGALNTFGEKYDFEGNDYLSHMNYQIIGRSINSILSNKILEVPNYIKIDVDGIEHLILQGADKYLNDENLKSLSIEINHNFLEQYQSVLKIMNDYNFKILHKKNNFDKFETNENKHSKTYNYFFIR